MKKLATYLFLVTLLLPVASLTASASAGEGVQHSGANINDAASLQRGAKWYVNYCLGCHTISYMRYNRLAADLDLSEEMVMLNLVTTDAKFGETMGNSMDPEQAKEWFGKNPPDLSLIGRSRGPDWIYSYLLGFYSEKIQFQHKTPFLSNLLLENRFLPVRYIMNVFGHSYFPSSYR